MKLNLNALITLLRNEPALAAAIPGAVVSLIIGFGIHLTTHQVTIITAAVTFVVGLVVRQFVTPAKTQPPASSGPASPAPPK